MRARLGMGPAPETGAAVPPPDAVPQAPLAAYLTSREFWVTLVLLPVVGLLGFFLLMYVLLPILTRQGASVRVPKVEGMAYAEAKARLDRLDLKDAVLDSQYQHDKPAGTVLMQTPAGGETVKPGRAIYLVVNKQQAPNTTLPDVIDVNLQQAEYVLGNWSLNVGKVTYVAGDGRDLVLSVSYRGRELKPGAQLRAGTKLDLTVSRGYSGTPTQVPDLTGRSLDEATALLNAANLALGKVTYGKSPGAAAGTVYDQRPDPNSGPVSEGYAVDIFIAGDRPSFNEGGSP
ncbi:MAG: PASTA domain-containing protein [Bacteroidia bacterium]|nr:PASTA domain-containing protein [Bacteroidia bacterium]